MQSQQGIGSGQIVQLTCKSHVNGKTYFVIGKRFDKKCIYLVESNDVENVSNFDNSFFEIQRFEGADNTNNVNPKEQGGTEQPIKFGDEIKFRHINSGKYLSVAREYTETFKGSFKILLDEGVQPADITFQIMPYRTFEKLADPIRYKAKVNIYNQEEEIYLNIEGSPRDDKQKMKALVGTHVAESQWEINFYAPSYNPTNEVIRDKDLVYMVNSKSSGLLTLLRRMNPEKDRMKAKMVNEEEFHFALKQLSVNYPIRKEPKSFDCIWQISIRSDKEDVITHKMGDKKGNVQFNISFTHLIEEKQLFKDMITRLVYPQELNNKSDGRPTLNKSIIGQTIASGEYIRLGKASDPDHTGPTWLREENEKEGHDKSSNTSMVKSHNCTLKYLNFYPNEVESVVFQIIRIPEDLKKEIHEFIEAKQRIQTFIENLKETTSKETQSQAEESKRFREAQEILRHISQSLNLQKSNPQTVLQRQMILNDIGFIDLIMICLLKLHTKDKLSDKEEQINKLCNELHNILRKCCKDNKEIKSSLSKNHLIELLELSDIEANDSSDTETLKEIMKDNKYAIENVMTPNEVKKLIENFSKQPISNSVYSKFLQILRLICKTSEEVIPRNQKVVIQEFLQKDDRQGSHESRNSVKFDFKLNDNNEVKIVTPRYDRTSKSAFPEIDEELYIFFKTNPSDALAFLEWVDLVSDVCEGKNIYGKYFAESKFPTRVLQTFLNIPQLNKSKRIIQPDYFSLTFDSSSNNQLLEANVKFVVQGYIVRLINNAFVKTIYHKKRTFDRIYQRRQSQSMNSSLASDKKDDRQMKSFFDKVVQFLKFYVDMIKEHLPMSGEKMNTDAASKEITLIEKQVQMQETMRNVMSLLKNMIFYGLYPEHLLQTLMNNLLDILEKNIKERSIKNTPYTPEILEIINFYMDLDLKERVERTISKVDREINNSKLSILNTSQQQKKKENLVSVLTGIVMERDSKRINDDFLQRLIHNLLEYLQKPEVKDKKVFLLCLNTLAKFIEVERRYLFQLKETLIIDRNENIGIIKKLEEARQCFEVCEIKDLKGVSLEEQHELNRPIWDMKKECVIRHILNIMEAMKDNPSDLDDSKLVRKFAEIYLHSGDSPQLLAAYNQREKPNPKIQKMVKEMNLHKYFYSYIEEFTYEIEEKLSRKLLEIIYLCLAVFAWKNYDNKNELNPLLPYMELHAEHNNGSIEALREFFSENPGILYDEQKITRVTQTITNYIYIKTLNKSHGVKQDFNYASKLLDFFHALIIADNTKLSRNRILVLSYILDKDRLQITRPTVIEKILNNRKSDVDPQEITYLSVLFGLLAQLVDKESINIAKCKKLHKLEVLVTIMHKVKNERLKAATRDYVNKLYYNAMDNSYMEPILNIEMETFFYDLNEYIKHRIRMDDAHKADPKANDLREHMEILSLEDKMNHSLKEQKHSHPTKEEKFLPHDREEKYTNPIRYTYKNTAKFLNLEKILESLHLITENAHFDNEMKKVNNESTSATGGGFNNQQLAIKITQLYERLRFIYISYFFDNENMKSNFTRILTYFEVKIYQFNFKTRLFTYTNINSKNVDFKSLAPKHREEKQKNTHHATNTDRSDATDHQDQLSKCSRTLSNTDIERFFRKTSKEVTPMCDLPNEILSVLSDKSEEDNAIGRKYELKKSVAKILQSLLKRRGVASPPQSEESEYYSNMNRVFQKISYPLVGINEKTTKTAEVFRCINSMIYEYYEIFEPQNLTFYFRTLSHTIDKQKEVKENENFMVALNGSFSELMFKTIIYCNLQENIEVSYEFFKFVATYWDSIKQEKSPTPDRLYNLIHDDPKNEFLVKLDNFIVFLSNDIVRKLEKREEKKDKSKSNPTLPPNPNLNPSPNSKQHTMNIFDPKTNAFQTVNITEYGCLNKEVQNSHIFETFKNIFKFMQLLCENNFVDFKMEFREQKIEKSIKTNNRNLLIRSTIELRKLFRMYRKEIQDLPEEILDFLNEIAQIPCYDNQVELSKSTFFEDVCQFIFAFMKKIDPKLNEVDAEMFIHVESIIERFFKILLSLLESNSTEIYSSFVQKLDPEFFKKVLEIHEKNPLYAENMKNENSRVCKLHINMLIIQKQLETKIPHDIKILPCIQRITSAEGFDQKHSIADIESIEVRLDDKEHKLYFFKPSEAEGVDENNEYIQKISGELNRSTHLQKLDSLLTQRRNLELYMVYQNYLRNSKYDVIPGFLNLNTYATLVSVVINVILMVSTSIVIVGDYVNSFESWRILLPLQILQFVLGTLYFFSDVINCVKNKELIKYNEIYTVNKKPEPNFSPLGWEEWRAMLKEVSPSIIYYFICVLGLLVSPYYYSIHLFYLFAKIKVLENVFKAVITNIYQLMYLAILGIAFFIVFSILTLDTYAPFANEEYCNSIWECFLVIYNKEIFMEESEYSETRFRSLSYEVLYSVFFGSLFGNIISGLMTDTFAELRDKENEIAQDENNFCYICGCSRFEIERENKEKLKLSDIYGRHTDKHNKWSYLFYLYQLQKKDKTEYTGLEYIISKKVEKNKVVWFPIKKTEENPTINQIKNELARLEKIVS